MVTIKSKWSESDLLPNSGHSRIFKGGGSGLKILKTDFRDIRWTSKNFWLNLNEEHIFSHYILTENFKFTYYAKSILHIYLFIQRTHNGENDSQKRQFLALGVCSQSWKLYNLSKKISCQIDWCYKLLATIWQNFFLLK